MHFGQRLREYHIIETFIRKLRQSLIKIMMNNRYTAIYRFKHLRLSYLHAAAIDIALQTDKLQQPAVTASKIK